MSKSHHHTGHRSRLRQRYLNSGSEGLHDYELLELLLTYAIPLRDVKPVAKELLNRFDNFAGVVDASPEELQDIPGIGAASSVLIKIVKDVCCSYLAERMEKRDALVSPAAVRDFARMKLSGKKDEALMVIYLNTKNHVNDYEILHVGTIDQTMVYPRTLIKKALSNNSSGLIIVHNHPSGICDPSEEDKRLTNAVRSAVETVDIRLVDHLIVGKGGYFSFIENELL
jgi:DNA repair protein RadC